MEIRYEDLLINTELELRKICGFLEIEFMDQMVQLKRPSERFGDARGEARVLKNNWGKYLEEMDSRTLRRVESIGGQLLVECGYDLVFKLEPSRRLTQAEMLLAQTKDAWNRLLFERKTRGLRSGISFMWSYFRVTRHK
jgi:hypothetical protein